MEYSIEDITTYLSEEAYYEEDIYWLNEIVFDFSDL